MESGKEYQESTYEYMGVQRWERTSGDIRVPKKTLDNEITAKDHYSIKSAGIEESILERKN